MESSTKIPAVVKMGIISKVLQLFREEERAPAKNRLDFDKATQRLKRTIDKYKEDDRFGDMVADMQRGAAPQRPKRRQRKRC